MSNIYPKISYKTQFYLLLLMISAICYGFVSPFSGFFHDEFSLLWFFNKMGDVGIMFVGNRPFQEYIFLPFIAIFGSYHSLWVIFCIGIRLLTVMTYSWILKQTWTEERLLIATASVGFLVYPGFQVQFSALMYGIYFLSFFIFLLSIGLQIFSVNNPRHRAFSIICSLILSGISLFTSEYFFTLEVIRYFLIWLVTPEKRKVDKFVKTSLPFLLLFIFATFWRLLIQEGETTYGMQLFEDIKVSFLPAVTSVLWRFLSDIWFTSISVWIKIHNPANLLPQHGIRILVIIFALVVGLGVAIYQYLRNISIKDPSPSSKSNFTSLLTFTVLSLIFAGIPFWVSGLPVSGPYYYTRWTIPFMIGGSLLIPILVYRLFSKKGLGLLILSFILAMGVGTQLVAANDFRHEHEKLNNFYWQLRWRIPSLKEGTVFFSDMLDFHYENSDQLSSGINFALSEKDYYQSIPYFLFFLPERYQTSVLPEIREDIPLSGKRYYSLFKGNTSQAILIDYQPPACLKILDPELDVYNPDLNPLIKDALFLSKPSLIEGTKRSPLDAFSQRVIGKSPEESWCYFFEKADVAFQLNNLDDVVDIFDEVENRKFKPRDGREWVPFVYSFALQEDFYTASQLTGRALELNEKLKPLYCRVWSNLLNQNESHVIKNKIEDVIKQNLLCE